MTIEPASWKTFRLGNRCRPLYVVDFNETCNEKTSCPRFSDIPVARIYIYIYKCMCCCNFFCIRTWEERILRALLWCEVRRYTSLISMNLSCLRCSCCFFTFKHSTNRTPYQRNVLCNVLYTRNCRLKYGRKPEVRSSCDRRVDVEEAGYRKQIQIFLLHSFSLFTEIHFCETSCIQEKFRFFLVSVFV